jgi:uncharacterized protein (TIGR02118 family)
MQCVTILYANKPGTKFNFDYYINKHLPLTRKLFGDKIEVRKGICSAFGAPPEFVCVTRIWISTIDEFMALMKDKGHPLISDIPNYTNVEPSIQFDEVLVAQ